MLPPKTPATPRDYSARSLRRHGRALSDALALTRDQVHILCPEIRNALGPIVYLAHVSPRGDDRTAAFKAVRRVVALLFQMELRVQGSGTSRREVEALLAGLVPGAPARARRRKSRRVVHD